MSLISNRHLKVIAGSLVIFVLFVFLLAQPSGVNNGITKPSKLENAPGISVPNSVPPIGDAPAPYGKAEEAKSNEKEKAAAAPPAKEPAAPAAPAKEPAANTPAKDNNKIQANKDKAEAVEEAKKNDPKTDVPTGSSSFAEDSKVKDPALDKLTAEDEEEFFKDAPNKTPAKDSKAACKDDIQYVVMIDAGSTGSRVHVYSFDMCFSPPQLLKEEFKMLNPGLSSFDTDTVGAAKSLDPLLQLALDTVPEKLRGCTPVAVKATAGLRLLGDAKSGLILKEVRRHLEEDFPFAVVPGDGISIMGGGDEGVFAWITTNFLLGNIGADNKRETAAVFDLGGGSTQIVFEPREGEKMVEGEHKYSIGFGEHKYTLYQYSHLGYGLMEGRNKINGLVVQNNLKEVPELKPLTLEQLADKELKASVTLKHPCIPPGVTADNVKVKVDDKTSYLVNFKSPALNEDDPLASSASTQCRFLADSVLNKDLKCAQEPCSFNGIYQPSLLHQFPQSNDMYIFSYFYDRLNPLGMPNSFTLEEIKDITKLVCSGSKFWTQYFNTESSAAELQKEPQWCLDLSFMSSLLHTGYDIPLARELKTAKTIKDNELGWCLGASLPLLDKTSGGWTCKVQEEKKAVAGSP